MTFLEMQLELELEFQNLLDKHIDMRTISMEHYLNDGYKDWIEEWYAQFEHNEAARKRLAPLVKPESYLTIGNGPHKNGFYFELDPHVKYILQEEAEIVYMDCNNEPVTETVEIVPIKLDYYNKHKKNPFKKPYKKLVWRLDIGVGNKKQELIIGDDIASITNYKIVYLAIPPKIKLLTGNPVTDKIEISQEFHSEVIDKARESALKMYQTASNFQPKQ